MTTKNLTLESSRNLKKNEQTESQLRDVSEIARKILLAVRQMNQAFSVPIVIAVLKGSKEHPLFNLELHKLAAYGCLIQYSENQIECIIQVLLDEDALRLTTGRYQAVKLGKTARAIIRKEKVVLVSLPKKEKHLFK